jgi:hypothetical protein
LQPFTRSSNFHALATFPVPDRLLVAELLIMDSAEPTQFRPFSETVAAWQAERDRRPLPLCPAKELDSSGVWASERSKPTRWTFWRRLHRQRPSAA